MRATVGEAAHPVNLQVRHSSISREAADGGHDAGNQHRVVNAGRELRHAGDRDVAARQADGAGTNPAGKHPRAGRPAGISYRPARLADLAAVCPAVKHPLMIGARPGHAFGHWRQNRPFRALGGITRIFVKQN